MIEGGLRSCRVMRFGVAMHDAGRVAVRTSGEMHVLRREHRQSKKTGYRDETGCFLKAAGSH